MHSFLSLLASLIICGWITKCHACVSYNKTHQQLVCWQETVNWFRYQNWAQLDDAVSWFEEDCFALESTDKLEKPKSRSPSLPLEAEGMVLTTPEGGGGRIPDPVDFAGLGLDVDFFAMLRLTLIVSPSLNFRSNFGRLSSGPSFSASISFSIILSKIPLVIT